MGRRKEPVDLILLKGKSNHLTNEEIEARRAAEIKAPADNIKPPRYLDPKLRKEFRYYAGQLADLKIFSNLDVDTLARYLIQRNEYLKVVSILKDTSPVLETKEFVYDAFGDIVPGEIKITREINPVYNDLRVQQQTFYTQCRQAASDLGLTISSRLKLVIPRAPEEEEVSEFEKRYNRV